MGISKESQNLKYSFERCKHYLFRSDSCLLKSRDIRELKKNFRRYFSQTEEYEIQKRLF